MSVLLLTFNHYITKGKKMKKIINRMKLILAIVIFAGMILPASTVFSKDNNHKQITRELINLVGTNPKIRNMLESSIAEAKKINPDPKTNPVQSLSEYYDFVDRASEILPHEILKGPSGSVRDRMLQGICYFYFIVAQPLQELEGKGLYKNSIQYYPPFSSWLRNFADAWGTFLDTKES